MMQDPHRSTSLAMLDHNRVMKTLTFLFLFCASAFGEDIATTTTNGDLTTKIVHRAAVDGKPELRIEKVYRGKTKIFQKLSRSNQQGKLAVLYRSYFVDGDLVMTETDEDENGVFTHIAFHRPGTTDVEMFRRQPDGSVRPVSMQQIESNKKQTAVMNAFMQMQNEKKDVTDQAIDESINRAFIDALFQTQNEKKDVADQVTGESISRAFIDTLQQRTQQKVQDSEEETRDDK